MLDLAGLQVPSHLQGQSLKPVVEGNEADLREFSASESLIGGAQARCVRTRRYKYVVYDSGQNGEQFFDLQNDPGEMNNLIADPDAGTQLEVHRKLLLRWCAEKGDETFKMPGRP
jgi:choline-sulfatase/glucosamine-6-phosphate deaminase